MCWVYCWGVGGVPHSCGAFVARSVRFPEVQGMLSVACIHKVIGCNGVFGTCGLWGLGNRPKKCRLRWWWGGVYRAPMCNVQL